jgi:hypothetical protein
MSRRVVESVWNWRAAEDPLLHRVAERAELRRRALLQGSVMVAVGALVFFLLGHRIVGLAVWGLAVLILGLGLAAPAAYRPLNRFGEWLGRTVGALLTYLMLVPLFYLVFLPVSAFLRMKGHDPLSRSRRDPNQTCWIPRRRPVSADAYVRQFLLEDSEARALVRPVGAGPELQSEGES